MEWPRVLLFAHLLAALFGTGFVLFQILLAGRVRRLEGTPDEGPVMRAHLAVGFHGIIFLILLGVTGLWMWVINDYKAMGSVGWLHAKLFNFVLLFVVRGVMAGRQAPALAPLMKEPGAPVTPEIRAAYRKTAMATHIAMALVLANIVLGFWKPGA